LFGLPSSTSCDNFKPNKKLQPGYNSEVITQAVELYKGGPVIDASDEARALRFVQILGIFATLNFTTIDNFF